MPRLHREELAPRLDRPARQYLAAVGAHQQRPDRGDQVWAASSVDPGDGVSGLWAGISSDAFQRTLEDRCVAADGLMIRARPSSSRAKSCHIVAYWRASCTTMPTQCGGTAAAASGSCSAPTALTCSSRSIPLPRSLCSDGSRSSFSTAAAGPGGAAACELTRMAGSQAPSLSVSACAPLALAPLRAAFVAGFSGTGDSPRFRRLRTSRTVAGDMPAARATSRNDASGCCVRSSAARRRPAPLSSGRTLPSLPTRAFDCGISSLEPFLMAATVFAARPAEWPIARSDMCGCDAMIRSGAAIGLGQRQAVGDVLLDRPEEDVSLAAVEEYDVDGLASLQGRGHQAVHPVDHPHGAPVHQDRRKRRLHLGEPRDMRLVLTVEPRGVGRAEREHGNGHHHGGDVRSLCGRVAGAWTGGRRIAYRAYRLGRAITWLFHGSFPSHGPVEGQCPSVDPPRRCWRLAGGRLTPDCRTCTQIRACFPSS